MKLLAIIISALAAFATAQSPPNPITAPTGGTIQAGTAVTITWTPTTQGTVTLQLRSGSANALSNGVTIASSISNSGSFAWTPDTSIAAGSDYTIEIINDADTTQTNFSPFFTISSSVTSASTGSSVSSTSASTGTSTTSLSSGSTSTSGAASSLTSSSTTTSIPLYINSTSTSTKISSATTHLTTSSSPSAPNSAGSSPSTTSQSGANTVARCGYGILTVAIGIGAVFAFV